MYLKKKQHNYISNSGPIIFLCDWCQCERRTYLSYFRRSKNHFCSQSCRTKFRNTGRFGKDHPAYRGIPLIDRDGYLRISCPVRRRLIGVHRLVMEKELGRFLLPTEDVHHKDHNRQNNEISNLVLMDHTEHAKHHKTKVHINTESNAGLP